MIVSIILIECGSTCTFSLYIGTTVTLAGSQFFLIDTSTSSYNDPTNVETEIDGILVFI